VPPGVLLLLRPLHKHSEQRGDLPELLEDGRLELVGGLHDAVGRGFLKKE
jgi:hypothetical protein